MDVDFEPHPSLQLTCACGRTFAQLNALSNHRRSCMKAKKRLIDALSSAREANVQRKRRHLNPTEPGLLTSTVTTGLLENRNTSLTEVYSSGSLQGVRESELSSNSTSSFVDAEPVRSIYSSHLTSSNAFCLKNEDAWH